MDRYPSGLHRHPAVRQRFLPDPVRQQVEPGEQVNRQRGPGPAVEPVGAEPSVAFSRTWDQSQTGNDRCMILPVEQQINVAYLARIAAVQRHRRTPEDPPRLPRQCERRLQGQQSRFDGWAGLHT